MVLCENLVVGDTKCYKFGEKYMGKFIKTEKKQIGYNRNGPGTYATVYTFENPWKPSTNPLENIPSLYAKDDVIEVSCVEKKEKGGSRKQKRKNRKGRKSKKRA